MKCIDRPSCSTPRPVSTWMGDPDVVHRSTLACLWPAMHAWHGHTSTRRRLQVSVDVGTPPRLSVQSPAQSADFSMNSVECCSLSQQDVTLVMITMHIQQTFYIVTKEATARSISVTLTVQRPDLQLWAGS